MSDLDFEAEIPSLEDQKSGSEEQSKILSEETNSKTLLESSLMKLCENDCSLKEKSNSKDNHASLKYAADKVDVNFSSSELPNNVEDELEEGEIQETCESTNPAVCRHYQVGGCIFGESCRFLHVGHSAYKMFNPMNPVSINIQPPASYPFQLLPPPPLSNAWEIGLEEAKMLLKKARNKRETDLDFEEKQLYMDLAKDQSEGFKCNVRVHKHKKCIKSNKSSDTKSKAINQEFHRKKSPRNYINYFSSKNTYSMSWVKKKFKKRARSRSSLSSNSRRRRSYSSPCSVHSSTRNKRSGKYTRTSKCMSKLERVFSRTFRKSNRRSISSSLSPYRSSNDVSPRSFSSSVSSSSSQHSGSYSLKKLPSASLSKTAKSLILNHLKVVPLAEENIDKQSDCLPESLSFVKNHSKLKDSDWESSSSDMTVSSITCTSFSDIGNNSFIEDSPKSTNDSISFSNKLNIRQKYTFNNDKDETKGTKSLVSDGLSLTNCANSFKQGKLSPVSFKIKKKQFSKIQQSENSISPLESKMLLRCEKETNNKKLEKHILAKEISQSAPTESNCSSIQSNQQRKRRKMTPEELELLKYVPNRDRDSDSFSTSYLPAKKAASNLIEPKPVTESTSLTNIKSKLPSSGKTRSLSRREKLMEQLKAIELAIARRKVTV